MRSAWNQASPEYQQNQQISTCDVYYGAWSPSENELQLLGDLNGKNVLDFGCGGGQSVIALARQGAIVTGVDISNVQLQYALDLARQEDVSVTFLEGGVEQLAILPSESWEVILSLNVLPYIEDPQDFLMECSRLMTKGGRLIISLDHPLRNCFVDEEDNDLALYPVRSYFDRTAMHWHFSDSSSKMLSYHRTTSDWIDEINDAGLQLLRLLEPPPVAEMVDALWPIDSAQAALRNIPQTIIFIAKKG